MNRIHALALAASLAALGNAFADDISADPNPFVSTLTRAQVQDELRQYRQSGINPWSDEYNPVAQHRSNMTREEATAAYIASRDEVSAMGAEDSGSSYIARTGGESRDTAVARVE